MTAKISKCTKKGQITLPVDWRKNFDTNDFVIEYDQKKLIVRPISLTAISEEVIFDAERDNEGKGVSVDKMIEMLKKIK